VQLSLTRVRSFFKTDPIHPAQMGLFILIELLLIFGKEFSKFHLFWQFHLYDFLLLLLAFYCSILFLKRSGKFLIWPIIGLLGFSFVYLLYSYFLNIGPTQYIVRHYALFIYLACAHLIFSSTVDETRNDLNIKFIILIGIVSVPIQVGTHIYNFITIENYPLFNRFNYFSLLGVLGIIVSGAYVLIYQKNILRKAGFFALILFISVTLGHASAFLSVFIVLFVYFILISRWQIKLATLAVLALSIWGFFQYFPQFSDRNSKWRLLYWSETIKESVVDYYGVLGHGFGVPFVSEKSILKFREQLDFNIFENQPEEQLLSPMHNSFITIIFHVGLLPGLLILIPLWPVFQYLFKRNRHDKNTKLEFLLLSLAGSMVWASFNVVLELPHSSAFFWLIYFSLIYEVNRHNKSLLKT